MDKRYLLFIAECHYPNGGLSDKIGSYDTLVELKKDASRFLGSDKQEPQIYDRIEGREIEFKTLFYK